MDMKAKENNVDNDVILFGLYAVIRIKDINIKLHNRSVDVNYIDKNYVLFL